MKDSQQKTLNLLPVKIVTAAALFDGHDASINIIRRILQQKGAEVVHLGHNHSVQYVVKAALQEGAHGICVSSYQGGHMEYFKYMRDLLDQAGATDVKIYGGGGGVIVYEEKLELERYGIAQIFHPTDGQRLGLEGMIDMIIVGCTEVVEQRAQTANQTLKIAGSNSASDLILDFQLGSLVNFAEALNDEGKASQQVATFVEESTSLKSKRKTNPLVLGITGTGGAGKSSLIDELIQRFLNAYPDLRIAVACVDPTKRKTGGSLLGDRIRMNSLARPHVFMRSIASRGSGNEISSSLKRVLDFFKTLHFDLIIAETSGIGQASAAITEVSDLSMYVMTSEFGAQSQLEKIDMIDYADLIAVNKADRRGALDALRDVRKQYKRSRSLFDPALNDESLPVFLTQAALFNDIGMNQLFARLTQELKLKDTEFAWGLSEHAQKLMQLREATVSSSGGASIVLPERQNYLANIVSAVRGYKKKIKEQAALLRRYQAFETVSQEVPVAAVLEVKASIELKLSANQPESVIEQLKKYQSHLAHYSKSTLNFEVRGQIQEQPLVHQSLSGTAIKRVVVPELYDYGDQWVYLGLENIPGEFPYTAGVFPLKRTDEEPKRMFAGEGTPERTNQRFHYLCKGEPVQRLSTAFDSVTLYGEDPDRRPDIFGKVGESGVSISTLNDMKALYDGFDLCDPKTSVSMTINGPAPMILAFFFNTAIDQQVAKKQSQIGRPLSEDEYQQLAEKTLQTVRGTVQADILKEDQGQNTCIFSIQFALKMMGDIQQYFVNHKIRNFYSVSISGYHIAEAGANPISQLAFTLSNGFTFIEYYLARGMHIDDFAPNLSFFFSNGMDPEYSVLGRVARRIWAIAIRDLYGGNERSQKLKYHIQTSGRSLHAQEIDFNDIRTTLQALLAIYDNCNSLHTNAYDEAITTPTADSVRRAMAIQLIINREFGMAKNENPQQGSYFVSELTELVEEAVLSEFLRINERGGVLGAMETQYQRSKIQEESLLYETMKHDGSLPIIGVNTFLNPETLKEDYVPPQIELARASQTEKELQLQRVTDFKASNQKQADQSLLALKNAALAGENIFAALMEASRVCSLGQVTHALFEVGGQYRRNL